MKKLLVGSPQDYLALVIRRRWWVILPFVASATVVLLVAYHLPDVYISETTILVEPREVSDDFVKDLVSLNTDERLDAVLQRILSRSNLLRIINEFGENLPVLKGLDDDQRVVRIKSSINIESETRPGKASYFKISFQSQNPEWSQKVSSRLASLFIEYDNRTREEQVFGTTEFLESELQKVSRDLKEVEEVRAGLKKRFRYELPDQLETNLRALDRLYLQIQTNTEALDRATGLRLDIERQMSETEPVILEEITADRPRSAQAGPSPLVQEFRQKESLYAELSSRYTPKHPDVSRLSAELERLRQEIPPAELVRIEENNEPGWNYVHRPNPVHQNLKTQLAEVKRELGIREAERDWLQDEIKKYTERVQNTPQREQEMAAILRRYEELSKQYEDLRVKLVEGKLAESLESRQKGAQFVILDPANYPLKPSKPNRVGLAVLGLLVSLGFGLGIAFAVDFADQKLWTHTEVEQLFGVPVLVEIPEILTPQDMADQKRQRLQGLAACLAVGVVISGTAATFYTVPNLRALAAQYFRMLIEVSGRVLNV